MGWCVYVCRVWCACDWKVEEEEEEEEEEEKEEERNKSEIFHTSTLLDELSLCVCSVVSQLSSSSFLLLLLLSVLSSYPTQYT